MKKAVFIDKDGTLIRNVPYNVDPELIDLEKSCVTGLMALQQAGYHLIVVSNQAGVARGIFDEDRLERVKEAIKIILAGKDIHLDGFYYCPHHPEGIIETYRIDCNCRKPRPGMILQASRDLDIDLSASWMIGDILDDVEAGNRAGCKTVLIDNGNETEWIMNARRMPTVTARTINEAAELIMHEIPVRTS